MPSDLTAEMIEAGQLAFMATPKTKPLKDAIKAAITASLASAPKQGMREGWKLPDWNALTNEQRKAICDEGERWNFDNRLERDAAHALYNLIKEIVALTPQDSGGKG